MAKALARNSDPETSHDAAGAVEGEAAARMEAKVLAGLLANPDGLTSHELESVTGMRYESITPRMRPLCDKGLIEDTGIRLKRPGSKRGSIVWKAIIKPTG